MEIILCKKWQPVSYYHIIWPACPLDMMTMYSMASLYIVNKVTLLDTAVKQTYWGDGRWSETGIR